jgi:hypothetical protein
MYGTDRIRNRVVCTMWVWYRCQSSWVWMAVAEGWDWWLDRLISAICHGRSGLQEALTMYVARSEQTQTLRSVDAKHETVRYLRLHGVRLSICQGNIAVDFGS